MLFLWHFTKFVLGNVNKLCGCRIHGKMQYIFCAVLWFHRVGWCWHGSGGSWRCLKYFVRRARLNLQMVEQLDLVGRTAELARTFGIDFFSVLTRGTQYRVESMMVRLAHSQNYLMLSASKVQVWHSFLRPNGVWVLKLHAMYTAVLAFWSYEISRRQFAECLPLLILAHFPHQSTGWKCSWQILKPSANLSISCLDCNHIKCELSSL